MKKYTYLTDHQRTRDTVNQRIDKLREHMDIRQLMKLYAFAYRMARDKVK